MPALDNPRPASPRCVELLELLGPAGLLLVPKEPRSSYATSYLRRTLVGFEGRLECQRYFKIRAGDTRGRAGANRFDSVLFALPHRDGSAGRIGDDAHDTEVTDFHNISHYGRA